MRPPQTILDPLTLASYAPVGSGMPQRVIVISSSPPELRTTGAG